MEKVQLTDQNQLRFNQSLLVAAIPLAFALNLAQAKPRRAAAPGPGGPRPHRFARTVGAVFLGLATLAFGLEAWVLAFAVAALALLSLTTRVQLRLFQHRLSR